MDSTDFCLTLPVKVTPKSRSNQIAPFQKGDTVLKIKITAPPEDGKANQAIITLLAQTTHCRKAQITFITGQTSRQKIVAFQSVKDPTTVLTALAHALHITIDQGFCITAL